MIILPITSYIYIILIISALPIYWLLNGKIKIQNFFLLIFSYLIYCFITYWLGIVIFISTSINYITGLLIGKINRENPRKFVLLLSLIFNLLYLFIFKYFDFFSKELFNFLSIFGIMTTPILLNILLPIGISYYTLQLISYNYEVYKGSEKPVKNFITFSLFVAYFPKISSGPIERSSKFIPQIESIKKFKVKDFNKATQLLLLGFFKKIVIADLIAYNINGFFENPINYSSTDALIIVILFTLQLFADFSGYTDIVRGISKFFGIDISYNFNQPFLSMNIRTFWRRWHMSFSQWLRDYIYIPLGGNRKGSYRMFWNIMIVFIICGIWHGAGINFIIFGILHGIFMILQGLYSMGVNKWSFYQKLKSIGREGPKKYIILKNIYKFIAWFILFQSVCFAFIFLRAVDFHTAIIIILNAYSLNYKITLDIWTNFYLRILIFSFTIIFTIEIIQFKLKTHYIFTNLHWFLKSLIYSILLISIIVVRVEEFTPFIYVAF